MKWQFNTTDGRKNISLTAELICTTLQIEEIKISGPGIFVVLLNNRPLLEAIELKQPLTWRIIDGEMKDETLLKNVKIELEKQSVKAPKPDNSNNKKVGRAATYA